MATEKCELGRDAVDLTSLAGYAGGEGVGKDANRPDDKKGVVCYHNMMDVGDYGGLGHGKVVCIKVPDGSIGAFAGQYFAPFGADSERPDKGDRDVSPVPQRIHARGAVSAEL